MSILDENLSHDDLITPRLRAALFTMAPWLRFIGIFGLVISAIAFVFFLLIMVAGSSLMAFAKLGAFAALPSFFFVIYLAIFALSIYLYYLLFVAGNNLMRYKQTNNIIALEEAIIKQKNFWVIVGVLLAIYLVMLALGIFFMIVAAVMS